jgi:hypothetical protein
MIEVSQAWINGEMSWESVNGDVTVNVPYIFGLEQDMDSTSLYALHAVYHFNSQRWEYTRVNRWFQDGLEELCPVLQIFIDEIGKQIESWFDHSVEARIKNMIHDQVFINKQVH